MSPHGTLLLAYFAEYFTHAICGAIFVLIVGGCITTWLFTRRKK